MENKKIINLGENDIKSDGYQILITNIYWNSHQTKQYSGKPEKYEDLPSQFALDLPENVLNQAKKKQNEFNDVIESFTYSFLTRKYGHEVNRCQIWLPLDK